MVKEREPVNTITCLRQSCRDVVECTLELDAPKPASLREPIEDREARIELEIQLVRVGASVVSHPFGG